MNDLKVKIFASDLRRVLYLQQLLTMSLEDLKMQEITPSILKVDCNNQLAAIRRFRLDCDRGVKTKSIIDADLGKEQLKDISILLDEVSDIEDIEQITQVIREAKYRDKAL
jgi:hypothetical protein